MAYLCSIVSDFDLTWIEQASSEISTFGRVEGHFIVKGPPGVNEIFEPSVRNAFKTGITLLHLVRFWPSGRDTLWLIALFSALLLAKKMSNWKISVLNVYSKIVYAFVQLLVFMLAKIPGILGCWHSWITEIYFELTFICLV